MVGSDVDRGMAMGLSSVTTSNESLCAAEYAYYLRYRGVGDFLAAHMQITNQEAESASMNREPAQRVTLLQAADDFAYFCVVDESKGDVGECELLCELFHEEDHAVDARIEAQVTRERSETVYWSAVEYASYLGYVDVVKYLLKEKYRMMAAKDKIRLLRQTQQRQQEIQETGGNRLESRLI